MQMITTDDVPNRHIRLTRATEHASNKAQEIEGACEQTTASVDLGKHNVLRCGGVPAMLEEYVGVEQQRQNLEVCFRKQKSKCAT